MADTVHPIAENRSGLIGAPLSRVDGRLKVTGAATYAAEHDPPGLVHGFLVESTVPSGRVAEIDTAEAERAPGVIKVLTHRNAPKQAPFAVAKGNERMTAPRPVLNKDEVDHHGQFIGVVVADTYENARAAAKLVRARYEGTGAPKLDFEAGIAGAYKPDVINGDHPADTEHGDFGRAFAEAPVKVSATYETPYEHNNPLEPHAAVASWEGDRVTIYDCNQGPVAAAQTIAGTLGLPPENVRVISRFIGGGFGSKYGALAHNVLAAVAAREVGRPVKLVLTRQQMFTGHGHRSRTKQEVRLGATRDGTITAVGHDSWLQTSVPDEFVEQSGIMSRMMYAGANRLNRHRVVRLNLATPNWMRAPGEAPGSFALESAMDELAVQLGMDPIELRVRNEPGEDPEHRLPFSSRSLVRCLREGAARFGWDRRSAPRRSRDGRFLVGVGVACATYPALQLPSSAEATLRPDGRLLVRLAATDLGTGTYTVFTQLAAETMGLRPEEVTVEIGDTLFPPTFGSGGSFGASTGGSALYGACLALRRQIAERAAADRASPLRGLAPGAAEFRDGRIVARGDAGRGETLRAVAARAGAEGVKARFDHKPDDAAKRFSMHSFGAQFAEVGVDEDTGEVRLRRMLGVFSAGRVLNAKTARSQLMGGMIMGLGQALFEESVVDPRFGHFVNHDLGEYHIPVHADLPGIEAMLVPEEDPHVNPLGTKGIGEVGIVGAAAAVANAVHNATGVRVRGLPITLDKVMGGPDGSRSI